MPFILHLLETSTKGNKAVYFSYLKIESNCINILKDTCSGAIDDDINSETLVKSFKYARSFSPSVYINVTININFYIEE